MMNKQDLEKRMLLLMKQRSEVHATLQAYDGAIQECRYWIEKMQVSEDRGSAENVKNTGAQLGGDLNGGSSAVAG